MGKVDVEKWKGKAKKRKDGEGGAVKKDGVTERVDERGSVKGESDKMSWWEMWEEEGEKWREVRRRKEEEGETREEKRKKWFEEREERIRRKRKLEEEEREMKMEEERRKRERNVIWKGVKGEDEEKRL